MAEPEHHFPEDGVLLARITIERKIMPNGDDLVWTDSWTPDDAGVPLIEALGMIDIARCTIYEEHSEGSDG